MWRDGAQRGSPENGGGDLKELGEGLLEEEGSRQRKQQCKGPGGEPWLVCLRDSEEADGAGAEWVRGRGVR